MKNKTILLIAVVTAIISLNAKAQSDELLFTGFKQGKKNNCASVALIKAAIYKYGLGKVVSYEKMPEGIHVLLKNGKEFSLLDSELAKAKDYSGFVKTNKGMLAGIEEDRIINYADTLYAIEAKYISLYGYSGCEGYTINYQYNTFDSAANFISDPGVCTDYVNKYLGLKVTNGIQNYSKEIDFKLLKGVILFSEKSNHAIAVYQDKADGFGELYQIKRKMKFDGLTYKQQYLLVLDD